MELLRFGIDRRGRPRLQRGGDGAAQAEAKRTVEGSEAGTPAHGGSIGHLLPAPPHCIGSDSKVYTLARGRAKHLSRQRYPAATMWDSVSPARLSSARMNAASSSEPTGPMRTA